MKLQEIIDQSVYGTIGYISRLEDIDLIEQYILYNLTILKKFKKIIVATNYKKELYLLGLRYEEMWKKYFSNIIFLHSNENRGHNHGYTDLDNMIFDYCKDNEIKWLCKSSNDMIFTESMLDIDIEDANFYYMNGIGYGGMVAYNFNFDKILKEDFYPQTNFYFLDVSKVDYLNNKDYLNETYKQILEIPNYNGRIWEYINGWSCENFLKQCILRNNLIKYHLINQEKYIILLEAIKQNQIHDSSHKNIMINGICHLQNSEQQILEI
jgi:hypothetical protein